LQGHQFLVSCPSLPEERPLPADLASAVSEAPEAEENQDEDDVEISDDETSSTTSPPPTLSEDLVVDKRGNVSKNLLLRVLPSRELRPVKPLFKKMT
jgi:hypothetical protein